MQSSTRVRDKRGRGGDAFAGKKKLKDALSGVLNDVK